MRSLPPRPWSGPGARTSRAACAGLLLAAGALFAAGCGRAPQREPDAADADPSLLPGRALYQLQCAHCHGRDGRGAPPLYPPLRDGSWVSGDPSVAIRAVILGLEGEITVNGVRYMNRMPPLGGLLTDAEIAQVLSYVRASWGNGEPAVTADQVGKIRVSLSGGRGWTTEELDALKSGGASPAR